MKTAVLFIVVAVAALVAGCHEPKSVLVKRPENATTDVAVTALWAHEIHNVAQDGDWVLTRSYYILGDAIALGTGGEDLSHASIYDAKRDSIIEAVGSGVREISLKELLQRNHYVIVVRPSGLTAAQRTRSVERARSRVGQDFDIAGMFGFDNRHKVYCSELLWWASQVELRTGEHETVITPSELMEYGEVVYWSGKRDDEQVMNIATSREPKSEQPTIAAAH